MISRQHFDESSHWHLRCPHGGDISIRWLKQDDGGYKARLIQYASAADRNYKSIDTVLGEHDAYDRIISAIGRYASAIVEKHLGINVETIINLRVGMLPADKNPFELQLGTGKSGNGFLVASQSTPGRIMIITAPETQYDPGKNAVFIEIEKSGNSWNEVPLSPKLIEAAKGYYAPWMRKALDRLESTAPPSSFAA
jgi:hypothetical protein